MRNIYYFLFFLKAQFCSMLLCWSSEIKKNIKQMQKAENKCDLQKLYKKTIQIR